MLGWFQFPRARPRWPFAGELLRSGGRESNPRPSAWQLRRQTVVSGIEIVVCRHFLTFLDGARSADMTGYAPKCSVSGTPGEKFPKLWSMVPVVIFSPEIPPVRHSSISGCLDQIRTGDRLDHNWEAGNAVTSAEF